MNAQELRQSLIIEQYTATRDTYGGEVQTWTTFATVRARKSHQTSREFFAAQKVNAEIAELFVCRYKSGVTTKMRVDFDSKYYDIAGANDPDGKKRELHILCKEVE